MVVYFIRSLISFTFEVEETIIVPHYLVILIITVIISEHCTKCRYKNTTYYDSRNNKNIDGKGGTEKIIMIKITKIDSHLILTIKFYD